MRKVYVFMCKETLICFPVKQQPNDIKKKKRPTSYD